MGVADHEIRLFAVSFERDRTLSIHAATARLRSNVVTATSSLDNDTLSPVPLQERKKKKRKEEKKRNRKKEEKETEAGITR